MSVEVTVPQQLSNYARLRFERLVKLSRDAVSEITEAQWDNSDQFLILINLYADLLAQALLDNRYSKVSEWRILTYMLACAPAGRPVHARVEWLADRLATDLANPPDELIVRLNAKKGAIALSSEQIRDWLSWVKTKPAGTPDCVIAILSRALTDAALISRVYEVPVRYACYSRRRLATVSTTALDIAWLTDNHFARPLLIDAHCETGETLRECWKQSGVGARLLGALVTDDETAEGYEFEGAHHAAEPAGKWSAFIKTEKHSGEEERPPAPLLILCGYPGSGKTLLRKAIAQRTGWPSYSWSRTIRHLLDQAFGGTSMETVRLLTREEQRDPEIVAREFLITSQCHETPRETPLVIDGVKSLSGVDFLKRQLGRPATIIAVHRHAAVKKQAIETRNRFDDHSDSQRNAMLDSIGLDTLIDSAELGVDASDSDPKTTSASMAAFIEVLMHRTKAQLSFSPASLRLTATLLLVAPDKLELLLLKSARSHRWGLPGGYLESGETPWEAAKRELREETGLDEPDILKDCAPFVLRRSISEGTSVIGEKVTTIFVARARSREISLSSEHDDYVWVTPSVALEMLSFPLSLTLPLLRELVDGLGMPAE